FSSSWHLGLVDKKLDNNDDTSASASNDQMSMPIRRSCMAVIDWKECIFCQRNKRRGKLSQVINPETSASIIEAAQKDDTMRCRLASVSDLVARKAKYHLYCYTNFFRCQLEETERTESVHGTVFVTLTTELRIGIANGHIYSMNDVCDRYTALLQDAGIEDVKHGSQKQKLKAKLLQHFGTKITFIKQCDRTEPELIFPAVPLSEIADMYCGIPTTQGDIDDECLGLIHIDESDNSNDFHRSLHHVTAKIRSDLNSSAGHTDCRNISTDAATKVVPDSLYLFLRMLFEGTDDDDDDNGHAITENTRRKVLSIGQDVVFACSESRKLTPKHIGIGLTVHQATRSKQLVNLLHAAGHSASYEVIRKVNVSLAKDQLSRFSSNGNVVVPVNLNKGKFVQYAADNIDINEETLDGSGTFHATQMVAFQRGPPRVEDTVLPISNTRVITSVPK
ncbi:MAG: hypothetical protein ABW185_26890, partial [Sedimenticola sp.]